MNISILDIETLAQPEYVIRAKIPAFRPEKVALGNAKKPETVAEIIETARLNHGNDIVAKAALYPEYGQVAIAGFYDGSTVHQFCLEGMDEREIISEALAEVVSAIQGSQGVLGWNVLSFDMMFLVKRAWILGVKVPSIIFNPLRPRYPWCDKIIDLMEVYKAGVYRDSFTVLDNACKALGIEGKSGTGKQFAELWETDVQSALSYNADDLRKTMLVAERLIG